MESQDYRTELFRLASPLFLYLVSFRRKVKRGFHVDESEARQELERIFTDMDMRARRDPRLDALYEKARYPLVILADEVLLNSGWDNAASWEKDVLEERYFNTNIGGDKLFHIADELRHDEVELAVILYTAVCLGVKGRYHRQPEKLEEMRSRLYRQLGEYLGDVQNVLTPDAYHVSPKPAQRLSVGVAMTRVAIAAVVLLVSYWIANWAIWTSAVADLREIVRGLG